ncbi:MAG TPA: hypothetical protein VFL57_15300 [Bryobacteraceae bacterium]|nr:hypothetical protein [Bryobacteraceae bacterium]
MIRILAVVFAITMTAQAAVKIERTVYGGWPNCYRITNGSVELIVTTDVGPRVIRYGFVGGRNMFAEFKDQLGKSGEKTWVARGGHRVWIAPEDIRLTYALDNSAVKAEVKGETLMVTGNVEPETGLQKQMVVRLAATGTNVEVHHRITNVKARTGFDFAPWVLTMMAQGGHGITGFPPRGTHPETLAPTNPLVMWAFTDLSDPRWKFTKKYMILRQDPRNTGQPQKLGHFNSNTWGAYLLGTDLFLKRCKGEPGKRYPDMGASFETFTNADFLELETLGPLATPKAGTTVEHVESWSLHRNVKVPAWTDAELDRAIGVLIGR